MSNTVTLVLDGTDVPLNEFVQAATRFQAVVAGLTRGLSGGREVDWILDNLDISSAIIGARGRGETAVVDAVVREYNGVGRALRVGEYYSIPENVREDAAALIDIIGPKIPTIRFETEEADSVVTQQSKQALKVQRPLRFTPREPFEAMGAVEGRVQTLSSRNEYRFTLYDTIHDKAVSCYLLPSDEDIMRDAWGKLALVEGVVRRDGETGRPLTVRRVERIVMLPEGQRGSWRRLRGRLPATNDILPEDAIRMLRDAD